MRRLIVGVVLGVLIASVAHSGSAMDSNQKRPVFDNNVRINTIVRVDKMDVWYGVYADLLACKTLNLFDTTESVKAIEWAFRELKWVDNYGRVTIDSDTLNHLILLSKDKSADEQLKDDDKLDNQECNSLQTNVMDSKIGNLYRHR